MGVRGTRPERSPSGVFRGKPPKWSFASFSSNKKRKSRGVLGARLERPLSPGPRRSDRSYSGEACGFKYSAPPGQGEKPNRGVAPTATSCPRQRHSRGGHDARRVLLTAGARFTSRLSLGPGWAKSQTAVWFPPRHSARGNDLSATGGSDTRSAHRRCAVYVKA